MFLLVCKLLDRLVLLPGEGLIHTFVFPPVLRFSGLKAYKLLVDKRLDLCKAYNEGRKGISQIEAAEPKAQLEKPPSLAIGPNC